MSNLEENRNKKNGLSSIVSLIGAMIPLLLIAYCLIISGGSTSEAGAGAVWWLMIIYYGSIGIPMLIISIILGIVGLKTYRRKLAVLSLCITSFPLILFFLAKLYTQTS